MGSYEKQPEIEQYDVVIVGAGISGINAAYRVKTQLPGYTYTILEARDNMGGTWDLFKYPGIRSDSDLHTFGFPWRPWKQSNPIADGASIVKYIKETAASEGIDTKIQYHVKLLRGDWSTDEQAWTLETEANGRVKEVKARFVILGTGYYDYGEPLATQIPGLSDFKGTIVHPQFWPEDLDYSKKRIVIIGSGATAVTLVPNLADKAEHVTMLQRSPSYMITLPNRSSPLNNLLPSWLSWRLNRIRFLLVPFLFFKFCRGFPNAARRVLRAVTTKQLPKSVPHDPHFKPSYNPWEQRLCVCPDGDFYKSLHKGNADVATGRIKTVKSHSIELESGEEIAADMIVTATGLKIRLAGGADFSVDGEPIKIPSKFLWKNVMLQDTPNLWFVIGYTNASWTLGADASTQLATRQINTMIRRGDTSIVPRLAHSEKMPSLPVMNLNSTYIQKAKDSLPRVGNVAPWLPRDNYFYDIWSAKYGDIDTGIEFGRAPKAVL